MGMILAIGAPVRDSRWCYPLTLSAPAVAGGAGVDGGHRLAALPALVVPRHGSPTPEG